MATRTRGQLNEGCDPVSVAKLGQWLPPAATWCVSVDVHQNKVGRSTKILESLRHPWWISTERL
eukprot:6186196-Pleurochrysis_carterae.AAC.2